MRRIRLTAQSLSLLIKYTNATEFSLRQALARSQAQGNDVYYYVRGIPEIELVSAGLISASAQQ